MNKEIKPLFLFIAVKDHFAGGIRLLAQLLKDNGYNVKIIFFKNFMFTTNDSGTLKSVVTEREWNLLRETLATLKPAWVGVSYTSTEPIPAKDIFKLVHEAAPDAVTMCGGFGPTFEPEKFLNSGADYTVRGEGEYAMLEIAKVISSVAIGVIEDAGSRLKLIANLAWLEAGALVKNKMYPLFDMRKSPDYLYATDEILYINEDKLQRIDPLLNIDHSYALMSSRGCIGKCTYCDGGNWLNIYRENGSQIKRYRTRNVEDVIAECKKAKALGAKTLNFLDEFFIRPEKEYLDFFESYKREVGLPFNIDPHLDFIMKSAKRFRAIFEAGVWRIVIGIQTGSVTLSEKVYNRRLNIDDKLKAINLFHKHWISSAIHFITGHYLESDSDFEASLNLIEKIPFSIDFPARTSIIVFKFALLPSAPIARIFPIVREHPMSSREVEYRRWILRIRHILKDNNEFNAIRSNHVFIDKPNLLIDIFKEIYNKEYCAFWNRTINMLEGREVVFFGAGETYQLYKQRFKNTIPKAILIDTGSDLKKVDNIPVLTPDKVLNGEKMPIIIFSQSADFIARNILIKYPHQDNIIACCKTAYPYLSR